MQKTTDTTESVTTGSENVYYFIPVAPENGIMKTGMEPPVPKPPPKPKTPVVRPAKETTRERRQAFKLDELDEFGFLHYAYDETCAAADEGI